MNTELRSFATITLLNLGFTALVTGIVLQEKAIVIPAVNFLIIQYVSLRFVE